MPPAQWRLPSFHKRSDLRKNIRNCVHPLGFYEYLPSVHTRYLYLYFLPRYHSARHVHRQDLHSMCRQDTLPPAMPHRSPDTKDRLPLLRKPVRHYHLSLGFPDDLRPVSYSRSYRSDRSSHPKSTDLKIPPLMMDPQPLPAA